MIGKMTGRKGIGTAVVLALAAIATPSAAAPLNAFAGKYPFQKIGSESFLTNPIVKRAVAGAVWEPVVVKEALSAGVSDRIQQHGVFLVTSSCRPHFCGSVNWTIVIRSPKGPAAVCYHNDDLMGPSGRWYIGGQPRLETPDGCSWFEIPPTVISALSR